MPDEPIEDAILTEARGAYATSREILGLMQEPVDDPIRAILVALQRIEDRQQAILTKLAIMERKLAERTN
jgi:hypothetical protein